MHKAQKPAPAIRRCGLTAKSDSDLYIQKGRAVASQEEISRGNSKLTYSNILYDVSDGVALITLNRAQTHNALSTALVEEFIQGLDEADKNSDVKIVVVTGAGGRSFSAGYDMKEAAENKDHSFAASRARTKWDLRFVLSVWECSKPVLAMIDGYCLAGAFEFAMGCDGRYCSEASTFACLEARFASAATPIMPWIIGNRCRSLMYTGDTIGAQEAFQLGLVDQIFPKATLSTEVMKIARRMAEAPLETLRMQKRAINNTFEVMGMVSALRYGSELAAKMLAIGSPESDKFNALRQAEGLAAALRWRSEQFAPYE